MTLRRAVYGVAATLVLVLGGACSTAPSPSDATPQATAPVAAASPAPLFDDQGLVGRPQNRSGIGDVDTVFDRYEGTRAELIALYEAQAWFKDGLTRDEALFVERGLSFVAKYDGPRRAQIERTTIERKLYKYERLNLDQDEIELLLIYRAGDNADRQMAILKQVIPALEDIMGVRWPERALTVVNGDFEINDFNEGQFIRIASCCVTSTFILAHELAHSYWSMGPSWLNEGMADLYANFAIDSLNRDPPAGWRQSPIDLDRYYRERKAAVDSPRFKQMPLPRRLHTDGLYEAADVFLLDIRALIGADAFSAAARDIYLASDFGRYNLKEKRLEDLFLAHSKDKREAVMALFNKHIWDDNGERYKQLQELEAS